MFNHLGEEYHYQWVLNIIRNETGEEIFINKNQKIQNQFQKQLKMVLGKNILVRVLVK